MDALCPITHTPLNELELAVAFHGSTVPYECRALVEWLNVRKVNPMTNQRVGWRYNGLEIIGPLNPWCRDPVEAEKIIRNELKG